MYENFSVILLNLTKPLNHDDECITLVIWYGVFKYCEILSQFKKSTHCTSYKNISQKLFALHSSLFVEFLFQTLALIPMEKKIASWTILFETFSLHNSF